ncbi:branched-chain-amino-acid transaminase [Anaeropeptidivorans aminofermentans]|jgi:branched-chain amino acid aminotransferase|uniref:branched-chain-amino-acid transaminase n=1 Tax=Anaeropeptidivorans aminofermentans TaxID=2934315 RepID=UPI002024B8E2|nr:branched-chain-amino-acid transaminase [Anaeropeptidivorans aminofermentans]MBE6011259.1 branched-chain-amino-acid transaminase [Lachnospiraceae bacterium]
MSSDSLIYLDGEFVKESEAKVSVFDHGLLYGDGFFEGIRVYNSRVFKLQEHVDRAFAAAKAIMLNLPMTKEEMAEIILESCRKNNLKDGYIRLVVTRGKGNLGLNPRSCPKPSIICIAANIQLFSDEVYEKGLKLVTCSLRRNSSNNIDPQIKSLNYINNILGVIEANRAGADEVIFLNQNGVVAEGSGDNIFIIKDGVIYTPPIYIGALDGITRKCVMELAEKEGYRVCEKEFTLFNVYNADEVFLTGSAAELIAVTNVDDRVIGNGVCGPITEKLLNAYREYRNSNGTDLYQ